MNSAISRLLGITLVVLVVAAALSLSAWAQTMTREPGTNRRGNDYTNFSVGQIADCEQACVRDGRCRAFTFDARSGVCFLKDRVPGAAVSPGSTSGVKQDAGPGPGWRDLTEERGIDYHGGDYASVRVRALGECQERCRRDGRCASYSFDVRAVVCYLKDRIGDRRRDGDKIGGVKQGGVPPPPGPGDLWEQRGLDYHGGDYSSLRVRGLRDCQAQCSSDRRCRAYSYDLRAAVCYLKDRVGDLRRDGDKVTGLKPRY
jgi:PAN domain